MSQLQPQTSPFKDYESGGIAVAGFTLVGLGAGIWLGSIYHSLAIGISSLFIGTGVGLVVMAIISRDR